MSFFDELGNTISQVHGINPMKWECTFTGRSFKVSGWSRGRFAVDRHTGNPIEQYTFSYKNFKAQWRGFLQLGGENCFVSERLSERDFIQMGIECRTAVYERCVAQS